MKIVYGKVNLIIMLLCFLLGGAFIWGMNQHYLGSLQKERRELAKELQEAKDIQQALNDTVRQMELGNGQNNQIEDVSLLIPFGHLQPEILLATLEEAARLSKVTLIDQAFEEPVPFRATNQIENEEDANANVLMRTVLNLRLEGDNEAQFLQFIAQLEQGNRLIQVETFTLEQNFETFNSELEAAREDDNNEVDLTIVEEDQGEDLDPSDADESDNFDETQFEAQLEPFLNQRAVMRANVTLVVYYVESQ